MTSLSIRNHPPPPVTAIIFSHTSPLSMGSFIWFLKFRPENRRIPREESHVFLAERNGFLERLLVDRFYTRPFTADRAVVHHVFFLKVSVVRRISA